MEKAKPDATAGATAAAAAVAGESEGGRADYAWVSREPTSALHINMLECLVRALEEHVVPRAASTTAAAVAMAGADTRSGETQPQSVTGGVLHDYVCDWCIGYLRMDNFRCCSTE